MNHLSRYDYKASFIARITGLETCHKRPSYATNKSTPALVNNTVGCLFQATSNQSLIS
jgi:hypothetical protein